MFNIGILILLGEYLIMFSVTMWIHLHHGDEGLERFLRLVSEVGEFILLEPQPWKCYQTAARLVSTFITPEPTFAFTNLPTYLPIYLPTH